LKNFFIYLVKLPFREVRNVALWVQDELFSVEREISKLNRSRSWISIFFVLFIVSVYFGNVTSSCVLFGLLALMFLKYHWEIGEFRRDARERMKKKVMKKYYGGGKKNEFE